MVSLRADESRPGLGPAFSVEGDFARVGDFDDREIKCLQAHPVCGQTPDQLTSRAWGPWGLPRAFRQTFAVIGVSTERSGWPLRSPTGAGDRIWIPTISAKGHESLCVVSEF